MTKSLLILIHILGILLSPLLVLPAIVGLIYLTYIKLRQKKDPSYKPGHKISITFLGIDL